MPVSYLGWLAGAGLSWHAAFDVRPELSANLSLHAFGDLTGKLGRAFYELGNLYNCFAKRTWNCTVPWQMLFSFVEPGVTENISMAEFAEMDIRLQAILSTVAGAAPITSDAARLFDELFFLADILHLAAMAGRIRLGEPPPANWSARIAAIKQSHARIWLLRNRPGGLADSRKKLKFPG